MKQPTAHDLPERLALVEAHERLLAAHHARIHEQLTGATARLESTLARIKTLLVRMRRHEAHGQEA